MKTTLVAATVMLALAGPVSAQDKQTATPATIAALASCRGETDPAKRLACYDKAAGDLQTAITAKNLYVIDKTEVRETRRSLFGLPLPRLGLFGDIAKDGNSVDEIEGVARSSVAGSDGSWQVTLEDGSTWRQTDTRGMGLAPAKGSKVVVQRGALGSFKMKVGRGPAVKVRRIG